MFSVFRVFKWGFENPIVFFEKPDEVLNGVVKYLSGFEQGLKYNKIRRFVMKSNQPHLSHHHHSDSILDMQNHLVNKKLTSRSDSVHDTSTPGPQGSSPTGAPGGGRANCHVLDQNDPQQCCSGVGAVGSILENILYSVVFHGASSSSRASTRSN